MVLRTLIKRLVATFLVSTSNRNLKIVLFIFHALLHFLFLHQTATRSMLSFRIIRCYISCFYIKPQLKSGKLLYDRVATFLVSTSNRNWPFAVGFWSCVATFLVSTSNRNPLGKYAPDGVLLHFLFLHQTATWFSTSWRLFWLLHFLFLHQTATPFVYC